MSKWIILDRDGVINYDSDEYIKSPDEWIPIPGSLEAIARLSQAGYHIVVVTNQSGVGRKLYSEVTLQLIHQKMQQAVLAAGGHLQDIFYCPHTPDDNCACRKPKTGLFTAIEDKYKIRLTNIIAIGDKLTDIQAAQAVGCRPILVRTGKGKDIIPDGVPVFADLAATVDHILATE